MHAYNMLQEAHAAQDKVHSRYGEDTPAGAKGLRLHHHLQGYRLPHLAIYKTSNEPIPHAHGTTLPHLYAHATRQQKEPAR